MLDPALELVDCNYVLYEGIKPFIFCCHWIYFIIFFVF